MGIVGLWIPSILVIGRTGVIATVGIATPGVVASRVIAPRIISTTIASAVSFIGIKVMLELVLEALKSMDSLGIGCDQQIQRGVENGPAVQTRKLKSDEGIDGHWAKV